MESGKFICFIACIFHCLEDLISVLVIVECLNYVCDGFGVVVH
jgi:hypothetical protein